MPSPGAVSKAAIDFMLEKMIRGRKEGWKKTTKEEDRTVMQTFKKLRPDGHGVDSRVIHKALPKKLKKKISRRLVIRRLAAKGYRPERKISKSDPGIQLAKRRVKFASCVKTGLQMIGRLTYKVRVISESLHITPRS